MKILIYIFGLLVFFTALESSQNSYANLSVLALNELTSDEKKVIIEKGTEMPLSGKYYNFKATDTQKYKKAYFAGGCFWGVEYYFEKLDGVEKV